MKLPHIDIDIARQKLTLQGRDGAVSEWLVSTARNGTGQQRDSECTPLGPHVVRARIGSGLDPRAVLKGRRPTGEVYSDALALEHPGRDWILGRILWLSGTRRGLNRLGNVDTMRRYIYIHGTPDREPLGVARSHGCIRMNCDDMVALFARVPVGTTVNISQDGISR